MLRIPGNIPIQIYPLFFIVVFALSAINSNLDPIGMAVWAFVIIFSLIVHEMGHALTAVAFGQRASIDLVGFGGVTNRHGRPLKPLQEFIIVFNGPLAGLALGAFCYVTYAYFGKDLPIVLQQILQIGFFANFFWTFVNLLPVQPLDGGQLLRITLEGFFGLKGLKFAFFLSFIIGIALSLVLFLILHQPIISIFFMLFTFESYRAWQSSMPMSQNDTDRTLQHLLKSAEKDFHKGHLNYAQEKLSIIRKQTKTGILHNSVNKLLARIFLAQGLNAEAYDVLYSIKNNLTIDEQEFLHQLAFSQNHWQEAITIGNALYQHQPTDKVALTNALCHARLGQARPAVGWLQCAIKNGLPNRKDVFQMEDFNPIRQDPLFEQIVRS